MRPPSKHVCNYEFVILLPHDALMSKTYMYVCIYIYIFIYLYIYIYIYTKWFVWNLPCEAKLLNLLQWSLPCEGILLNPHTHAFFFLERMQKCEAPRSRARATTSLISMMSVKDSSSSVVAGELNSPNIPTVANCTAAGVQKGGLGGVQKYIYIYILYMYGLTCLSMRTGSTPPV